MGVEECRSEIAALKEHQELIPDKETYEKMCIDAQRRNLSNLASNSTDHPPLTLVGMKRLMTPVCVTVALLGLVLFVIVAALYESLSFEINKINPNMIADKKMNDTLSSVIVNGSESGGSKITSPLQLDQQQNNTKNEPLHYLSTSDGVVSHFFQLQHLWHLTHTLGRSLTPVPFHSENHHPDVEWINLCDIFILPPDINCFNESIVGNHSDHNKELSTFPTPPLVAQSHKCVILGIYPWALDPKVYSLPHPQTFVQEFDFLNDNCVAGYVDEKSGFTLRNTPSTLKNMPFTSLVTNKLRFPIIKFTDKYMDILKIAKNSLGLNVKDGLTVAHWSGIYEPKKCKEHESGCLSSSDFIQQVNISLKKVKDKLVYVATDENNKTVLNDLSNAGFRLFSDLKVNSSRTLTSLDKTVLELILITESTNKLLGGASLLRTFSELVHGLKYDKS